MAPMAMVAQEALAGAGPSERLLQLCRDEMQEGGAGSDVRLRPFCAEGRYVQAERPIGLACFIGKMRVLQCPMRGTWVPL